MFKILENNKNKNIEKNKRAVFILMISKNFHAYFPCENLGEGEEKKSFIPVGCALSKAVASSRSRQMASTCFHKYGLSYKIKQSKKHTPLRLQAWYAQIWGGCRD